MKGGGGEFGGYKIVINNKTINKNILGLPKKDIKVGHERLVDTGIKKRINL